jgi:hypothetical protein
MPLTMPQAPTHVDLLEIFHARQLLDAVDGQLQRLEQNARERLFHDFERLHATRGHYLELREQLRDLLQRLGDTAVLSLDRR